MSKKPKPGGRVQISGKQYDVIEGPRSVAGEYRIMVRSREHQGGYWASAPPWQGGKGPWKISGPVISPDE